MVARNPDLSINPTDIIQGDVGAAPEHVQRFVCRAKREIRHPRLFIRCIEFIIQDQFGNWYLTHRATLSDGEDYDVAERVKPSVELAHGGFTDDLLDLFRERAFAAFDETEKRLAQVRSATAEHGAIGLILPENFGTN